MITAGNKNWLAILATGLVLAFCASANSTSTPCDVDVEDCRQVQSWEFSLALGVGGRTNPLVDGDNQPIVLVPQFSWYGKRFYVENFELGFTLLDSSTQMFNIVAQPGFDQVYFDDIGLGNFSIEGNFNIGGSGGGGASFQGSPTSAIAPSDTNEFIINGGQPVIPEAQPPNNPGSQGDLIDEIHSRKMAYLSGFEYSFYHAAWQVQIQTLHDISGVHDGSEFRFSGAHRWQKNKNLITLAAGVAWQSDELLDYYYGVDASEVNDGNLVFDAGAGISNFVRLSWERKLNKKWSFVSTVHYKKLDSDLTESPLLEESKVMTFFVGGIRHF